MTWLESAATLATMITLGSLGPRAQAPAAWKAHAVARGVATAGRAWAEASHPVGFRPGAQGGRARQEAAPRADQLPDWSGLWTTAGGAPVCMSIPFPVAPATAAGRVAATHHGLDAPNAVASRL
jgi:hypothetical protein